MAKLKSSEPITGYFIGGIVNKAGVASALDILHLHGLDEVVVKPVFHPDFDIATKAFKQSETKLLAAPANGQRPERGKTKGLILKRLLALASEVPYPKWKREVAKELHITPAGVENHCKIFRSEGLFKLQKGMLVPQEKQLNRVRNKDQGEAANA